LSAVACLPVEGDSRGDSQQQPDDAATQHDGESSICPVKGHQRLVLPPIETTADGKSPVVTFDLPACSSAFIVTVRGDDSLYYTIAELGPEQGISLVPKSWLAISSSPMRCHDPCVNRIVAQSGVASFMFPNTPLVTVTPGRYRLRLYAFERDKDGTKNGPVASQLQVHVDFVGPPVAEKVELKLPVNVCLTGAGGIDAAVAAKHPKLQTALAMAQSVFEQAGITLAPIHYRDVAGPSLASIQGIEGKNSAWSQLMRTGGGGPMGLNMFFVDKILVGKALSPDGESLLGLSGGVPGPPLEVGCDRCGVMFSLQSDPTASKRLGAIMAHEIGHYLGLFHPTEPTGDGSAALHDNLPDTKAEDTDNLMHWAVTEKSSQLTAQQIAVLRISPWLSSSP
jgi:hypothetical protein